MPERRGGLIPKKLINYILKIKDRLALNFTLISTGMLLVVLCSIYFIFLKFLEADFYARLTDRTTVSANLYLEADEISRDALDKVRSKYLDKLSDEVIRIYNSNNKATFIGDTTQYWTPQIINKVRKAGKIQFKDGENQVVGIFYKDNQGDFVILVSANDQSSHKRLNKLFKIMLVTFLIITSLLLISGRFIAKKILQPLLYFMEEVKKVGSSNLEFRVKETTNKDEINELAKNFNRLIEELEQAFILQKTFVANASHELRTPITSVMMSAELALSKERDITAYKQTLKSVLEDTEKIDNIITGLLTLAKADLALTNTQLQVIDLANFIQELQLEFEQQGLKIELLQNEKSTTILANKILLQIALTNIISNAFKFSDNKPIQIKVKNLNGYAILSITDFGLGIADEELENIFKPFYSKAEKVGKQGQGMGLYMTNKIMKLFKGSIDVKSKIDIGSTFTVTLPLN